MHDLIIIGAGPAGLSAAIYAARAELDYVLIEENFVNGGQIIDTYEIDNYPGLPGISGMDLAQKMADHAEKLGAEVVNAAVEGLDLTGDVKKVMTDEGTFEAKAVIIASGASHSHLGVPGEDWLPKEYNLKRSVSKYLAKVNGRRDIWKGVALNTNLCYSQAAARRKMVDAVVAHCAECPDIDYVHVWLSDGVNNFCECDGCRRMRPSDWYVLLLNEIDAKLTKRGLATKVVFLMYHDLLWEPEQQKLRNPDRFVLMFAPITRSYSQSYGDAEWFDEEDLSNFKLNQLEFPKSVGENLARMRRWQRVAPCEGFVYDYHYMWDHFFDPGYYQMAKILFADMRSLHGIGLNGMVSCQNQRVFFPNGLGMTAMAAALWNEKADFDAVAADYFRSAYGEQGDSVRAYMAALSEAFDPAYIRANRNIVSPENARKLAGVERIVQEFAQIAEWNARDASLDEAVRTSWEHLQEHGVYCTMLSKALAKRAAGDFAEGKKLLLELVSFVRSNQLRLQKVLDVFEFQQAVVYRLKWDEQTELPVL